MESGREEPPKDPQHQAETTPKPHRNNHVISSMSREHPGARCKRRSFLSFLLLSSCPLRFADFGSQFPASAGDNSGSIRSPGPSVAHRFWARLQKSQRPWMALGIKWYQKPTRKSLAPLKHGKNWNKLQSKQINHMHTLWWRVRLSKREIKSIFEMVYQDSMRLLNSIMVVFSWWLIKPQVITCHNL